MNKFFQAVVFASAVFFVSCSSSCEHPLRDAFNFYVVNGSGQDIFVLDPSLNKDSVYLSVLKGAVEQPATRSFYTLELVGADTLNTFYNPDIPDLNINSDTQTVFLYLPRLPKQTLQVITYNELDDKCGSTLRIGKVLKGGNEMLKNSGYYRIVL